MHTRVQDCFWTAPDEHQQATPLRELGVELTPEIIEYNKWDPFWDAPLDVPGTTGNRSMDLPRAPDEIRRATARYQVTGCRVSSEGARLEVAFPASTPACSQEM